ncbi:hypothetical protein FF38_13893 [Lucilia cuprina]|uniref:Transmembrane protein n=1 Tax=Lucilia cuprina TaxID=7375 RepID=A0A0L0C1D4_LUCCU|nr:hypothetical protein FF38_13893 [Lucilia cuprina]
MTVSRQNKKGKHNFNGSGSVKTARCIIAKGVLLEKFQFIMLIVIWAFVVNIQGLQIFLESFHLSNSLQDLNNKLIYFMLQLVSCSIGYLQDLVSKIQTIILSPCLAYLQDLVSKIFSLASIVKCISYTLCLNKYQEDTINLKETIQTTKGIYKFLITYKPQLVNLTFSFEKEYTSLIKGSNHILILKLIQMPGLAHLPQLFPKIFLSCEAIK